MGLLDLLPTPMRLYYDSIVGGDRSPITESNFTPEELQAIQQLIAQSKQPGAVSYPDYGGEEAPVGIGGLFSPKGRIANSLGQFNYTQDPTGTTVTDAYDFNPTYKDESLLLKAFSALGSGGFSPLHLLGEYVMPPGKGRPVKIRIPKK